MLHPVNRATTFSIPRQKWRWSNHFCYILWSWRSKENYHPLRQSHPCCNLSTSSGRKLKMANRILDLFVPMDKESEFDNSIINVAPANPRSLIQKFPHSLLKLSTGLVMAARMDWKLIVISAIPADSPPAIGKTHQPMAMR
jgi:hypothetical protein